MRLEPIPTPTRDKEFISGWYGHEFVFQSIFIVGEGMGSNLIRSHFADITRG